MQVAIAAASGACATHVFNYTLPTVYKQVNGILGCNLFDLGNDKINESEFTKLSMDPEVGYYSCELRDRVIKKNNGDIEEIKQLECIKVDEVSKCCSIGTMDIIADLAVISFVAFGLYKVSKNLKLDLNFDLDI